MEVTKEMVIEIAGLMIGMEQDELEELEESLCRKPTLAEIAKLKELLPEYAFRCETCKNWTDVDDMADTPYEYADLRICNDCDRYS